MTHHHRRRRPRKPSQREKALQAWLELQSQDPVAARYMTLVTLNHSGLVRWMAAAEHAAALPVYVLGASISQSREPDDRMLTLVEHRLEHGGDPEHLEPIRARLTHRLGDLATWYVSVVGSVDLEAWEPLAVRLGDLIGDQVAAGALATCLLSHARLAYSPHEHYQRARKNARDRWWRLAGWYVRRLDEQPEKGRTYPSGRVVTQYVEGEGERRYG